MFKRDPEINQGTFFIILISALIELETTVIYSGADRSKIC
jgi:hypothetical protein